MAHQLHLSSTPLRSTRTKPTFVLKVVTYSTLKQSAEIEIKDANGSSEAAAENMHSRRRTGGFFQTLKRAVGAVGALFSPPGTKVAMANTI
eukprot:1187825-Amorphochlora_amoeboformis.AAC.1